MGRSAYTFGTNAEPDLPGPFVLKPVKSVEIVTARIRAAI
jgi:hypothetical protein